jgi:biotin synthase-like enzyme
MGLRVLGGVGGVLVMRTVESVVALPALLMRAMAGLEAMGGKRLEIAFTAGAETVVVGAVKEGVERVVVLVAVGVTMLTGERERARVVTKGAAVRTGVRAVGETDIETGEKGTVAGASGNV